MTTPNENKIKKLIPEYLDARDAEAAAKQRRTELEAKLVELVGFDPDGKKSHRFDTTMGPAKLTLSQSTTRKVDAEVWERIAGKDAERLVSIEYKLDTKRAKAFAERNPKAWAKLQEAITSKRGKVSAKVVIEEDED